MISERVGLLRGAVRKDWFREIPALPCSTMKGSGEGSNILK